jgi:hypothetical protein
LRGLDLGKAQERVKGGDMSKDNLVQWCAPEKGAMESGPSIKVVKIRPNNPVKGFFLSDFVHCVKTHWIGGRTVPCIGPGNGCDCGRTGVSIRPKGYIAVSLDTTGKVWLLEITEKAFDSNLRLSATSGLRGLYFEAMRTGPNINSGLDIAVFDNKRFAGVLPQDIDVKAVLCRIWFGKSRKGGPHE